MQARRKKLKRPTLEELEQEISRRKGNRRVWTVLKVTVCSLIVVAAVALLLATSVIPVMRVYGTSMEPTLNAGQVLLGLKGTSIKRGDLIAFYYNNQVLLKRVIAVEGDTVNITEEGDVYVNGELLEEPYVTVKTLGICDITFPVEVPEDSYFVLGDHRAVAIDSRSSAVGMVKKDAIISKIIFRIWPLKSWQWF